MLVVVVHHVHLVMSLGLQRRHWAHLGGIAIRVRSSSAREVRSGRVSSPLVGLSASVLLLVAWVDEPLMADEEVAASEGLCTYLTHERLLFGVCSYMSLQMFLSPAC